MGIRRRDHEGIKMKPGDLVRYNSDGSLVHFTRLTRCPGLITATNPGIGKFLQSQLALVIGAHPYMNDRAADALILTSSGALGWCYAERLERVTR